MKAGFLVKEIDIQSEYKIVYYNYQLGRRVEIYLDEAEDLEVVYMYSEDSIIYIEVELDYEW